MSIKHDEVSCYLLLIGLFWNEQEMTFYLNRSIILYCNKPAGWRVVEDIAMSAGGLGIHSRASEIIHSVANGSILAIAAMFLENCDAHQALNRVDEARHSFHAWA